MWHGDSGDESDFIDLTKDYKLPAPAPASKKESKQEKSNQFDLSPKGKKSESPQPQKAIKKRFFIIYIDTKEKYEITPIEKKIKELNRTRHVKSHEVAVNVRIGGKRAYDPADISVHEEFEEDDSGEKEDEVEMGRFELKRQNDLIGSLAGGYNGFRSQLEATKRLGEVLPYVGLFVLYESENLKLESRKTLMTLTSRYQIRGTPKSGKFIFQHGPNDLESLAEIIFRVCVDIANCDKSTLSEEEKMERKNLRIKRPTIENAQQQLESVLRDISGFGGSSAFAVARDFKNTRLFMKHLEQKGMGFLDKYTPEDLGRKKAHGKSVVMNTLKQLGFGEMFNLGDDEVKKPKKTETAPKSKVSSGGKVYKPWVKNSHHSSSSSSFGSSKKVNKGFKLVEDD